MQGKRQHVLEWAPVPVYRDVYGIGRRSPPGSPAEHWPHRAAAPHVLVGVSSDSLLATVERLEADSGQRWLLWGSVHGRPVLFSVDEHAGREMLTAVADGEDPVAIVEPWELVGQALD